MTKTVKTKVQKTADMPKKKPSYYTGTGRRKEAVARVKLFLDEAEKKFTVNGIPVEKYFSQKIYEHIYTEPFKTTNTLNRFSVETKVAGSGNHSQLGAMVLGIARALSKVDPDKYRLILRRKGLLTRDARTRERRKVGRGGKARRQKQSPKR